MTFSLANISAFCDFLAVAMAVAIGYYLRFMGKGFPINSGDVSKCVYLFIGLLYPLLCIVFFWIFRMYSKDALKGGSVCGLLLKKYLISIGVIFGGYYFVSIEGGLSRLFLGYIGMLLLPCLYVAYRIYNALKHVPKSV